MSYNYTNEELYGRALFSFHTNGQLVNVAFEPMESDSYLLIFFAEDGTQINGKNSDETLDTIYDILKEFDNNRKLKYTIAKMN